MYVISVFVLQISRDVINLPAVFPINARENGNVLIKLTLAPSRNIGFLYGYNVEIARTVNEKVMKRLMCNFFNYSDIKSRGS